MKEWMTKMIVFQNFGLFSMKISGRLNLSLTNNLFGRIIKSMYLIDIHYVTPNLKGLNLNSPG